jgi:hypothetical protein
MFYGEPTSIQGYLSVQAMKCTETCSNAYVAVSFGDSAANALYEDTIASLVSGTFYEAFASFSVLSVSSPSTFSASASPAVFSSFSLPPVSGAVSPPIP